MNNMDKTHKSSEMDSKRNDSMLHILRANVLAKKTSVFITVFAVTCILMGGMLNSADGENMIMAGITARLKDGQLLQQSQKTDMPDAQRESSGFLQLTPTIPFSGEYPSVQTDPLVARPLIDVSLPTPDGFVYSESIPLSYELQKYTYAQCLKRELEYELVLALMWRESRFTIDAVNINTNGTQDSGIMQINDVNKGWLLEDHGIDNLMDPIQNIDAGTIMLSRFTKEYGVHDGLMAYQYGAQGMKQKVSEGVLTNDNITILIEKRDDFKRILYT